jgi:hypothetical protein
MKTLSNEELIIRLIRDSLINTKLISGLNALGLMADDYSLFLGDTIFLLMGFEASEQNDFIFENVYLACAGKVNNIEFPTSIENLDALSKEVYNELLFAKGIYKPEE